MSSKTTTSIVSESENKAVSESAVVAEKSADFSTKKMGVVRYCQLKELRSSYVAIMKRRYASEIHTWAEWESLLENVLNRRVK